MKRILKWLGRANLAGVIAGLVQMYPTKPWIMALQILLQSITPNVLPDKMEDAMHGEKNNVKGRNN